MTNKTKQMLFYKQCYEGLCKGLRLNGVPGRPSQAREVGETLTANMVAIRAEADKLQAEVHRLKGRSFAGRLVAVFRRA